MARIYHHPPSITLGRSIAASQLKQYERVTDALQRDIQNRLSFYEANQYQVRHFGKFAMLSGLDLDVIRNRAAPHRKIHKYSNDEILKGILVRLLNPKSPEQLNGRKELTPTITGIQPFGSDTRQHASLALSDPQLDAEIAFVRDYVNELAGFEGLTLRKPHITLLTPQEGHEIVPFMWESVQQHCQQLGHIALGGVRIFHPTGASQRSRH